MITLTKEQLQSNKENYKRLNLYKTDNNGSDYYHCFCSCDRCNGEGIVYVAKLNDRLVPATPDSGICWKCGGAKWINTDIKVMTEEHARYLSEQRAKRDAKKHLEAEQRMEETANKIYQNNLKEYHPVDFTLRDWFKENIHLDISVYKYYKVDYQTDKAMFIKFMCDLHDPEIRSRDRWIPIKAFIIPPQYRAPKGKRNTWWSE